MTEQRPTEASAHRPWRKVPPLAWIILGVLVAVIVAFLAQRGGEHVTPQGGTMPQAADGGVIPAAPGGPGVPSTPAGTVNGPSPATGAPRQ